MDNYVTPEGSMRQAALTSDEYFGKAIRMIDKEFGEGYAKANPQLIGAFMQTAALDYLAARLEISHDRCISRLSDSIGMLDFNN